MAVVKSVKMFRPFLHGAWPFDIVTSDPNKSGRLLRWYSVLMECQYSIMHRMGAEIAFVDALSRPLFPDT